MDKIKYETIITLKDVPIQWIPRLELFYPDLPQFPIVYVHTVKNGMRIFGFPVVISCEVKDGKLADVTCLFLSNVDLDKTPSFKKHITSEIEERFGLADKIGLNDVVAGCKGNQSYVAFFGDLWNHVSGLYGEYIPYGKFYEEIFSIVRFVSAWQPRTGRQSEMRMLYNFLSIFGEKVTIETQWSYLEFFVLPTYDDVKTKNFSSFPKFKTLYGAMKIIWDNNFTVEFNLDDMKIKSLPKAWKVTKNDFIKSVSYPLHDEGLIDVNQREALDRLVDAFNRHSWRAAYYIWSIMSITEKDYYSWNKEFFVKFYTDKNRKVGTSPKVVACFLQQGFKMDEAIPLDTWIEAFYVHALGIKEQETFFNEFDKLGKIERVIWLASQANKTNIHAFFYLLWCVRYGDTGNNELRGANPISCYECKLRNTCPSYSNIKDSNVLIREQSNVVVEDAPKGNGKIIVSENVISDANNSGCKYICVTEGYLPKKIFIKAADRWKLVDEFSGYLITTQIIEDNNCVSTVDEIISQLPSLF